MVEKPDIRSSTILCKACVSNCLRPSQFPTDFVVQLSSATLALRIRLGIVVSRSGVCGCANICCGPSDARATFRSPCMHHKRTKFQKPTTFKAPFLTKSSGPSTDRTAVRQPSPPRSKLNIEGPVPNKVVVFSSGRTARSGNPPPSGAPATLPPAGPTRRRSVRRKRPGRGSGRTAGATESATRTWRRRSPRYGMCALGSCLANTPRFKETFIDLHDKGGSCGRINWSIW